jgi:hypothetical protein
MPLALLPTDGDVIDVVAKSCPTMRTIAAAVSSFEIEATRKIVA